MLHGYMASKPTKTEPSPYVPPRILVLRYSSLGDVALTNPVLDGLRAAFPDAKIYFATKKQYAPVIQHHPALDGVLRLEGSGLFNLWGHIGEIRRVNPTLVLDLHDSLRTHMIQLFTKNAKLLVYDKDAVRRRLLVHKATTQPSIHTIQKYLKVL